MKNAILFSLASVLAFLFCKSPAGQSPLLTQIDADHAIFYDPSAATFFVLQFRNKPRVPEKIAFASFDEKTLKVKDLSTDEIITYGLSDPIYGLTKIAGSKYKKELLRGEGATLRLIPDAMEKLSCGCWEEGDKTHLNCDAGGEGATNCAYENGEKLSVKVSCGEGYHACCEDDTN